MRRAFTTVVSPDDPRGYLPDSHFTDEVENAIVQLKSGTAAAKPIEFLMKRFAQIFGVDFDETAAFASAGKLSLLPGVTYIGDEQRDFAMAARAAIYRYSEIDLEHHETAEIASGLISLVNRKSIAPILEVDRENLDDTVGVGLADLLAVLSISPQAYAALLGGEDPKALKT